MRATDSTQDSEELVAPQGHGVYIRDPLALHCPFDASLTIAKALNLTYLHEASKQAAASGLVPVEQHRYACGVVMHSGPMWDSGACPAQRVWSSLPRPTRSAL